MAKGRKTSKDERVKIVKYCINNRRNYKEAADKYNHILGYRRMTNWINRDKGTSFSKGRGQRIINLLGIKALIRAKRKKV